MNLDRLGLTLPIEVVRGRDAVANRFRHLQRLTRTELVILDQPPFPVRPPDGVRCRTIYPGDRGPAGPDVRVLDTVPTRFVIADRRLGIVPHDGPDAVLLLRPSAVLDGLIALFDILWEQAAAPSALTGRDRQLLDLLADGLTDQAIARQLGVALRTAERRVRKLMDGLGARTRFQAGMRAAAHSGPIGSNPTAERDNHSAIPSIE